MRPPMRVRLALIATAALVALLSIPLTSQAAPDAGVGTGQAFDSGALASAGGPSHEVAEQVGHVAIDETAVTRSAPTSVSLTDIEAGLPRVTNSSVAGGDYDNHQPRRS